MQGKSRQVKFRQAAGIPPIIGALGNSTPQDLDRRPMLTTVNAKTGSWTKWVMSMAVTTVMGPVGPATWDGVPSKTAAKKTDQDHTVKSS